MTDKFGTVPLPTPSDGSSLRVWYDPSASIGQTQQPQAQQVAAFEGIPNDDCVNGAVLDVNQHFVVYAVKNGLIRVLHRQSPLRSLLRGHTQKITDISFFQNGDVLGSVGGNVIIWRIFERSPEIVSEKLLEIPDSLPSISRLIWHPFNPNQFWLLHQNAVELQVATLVETTHITTVPHESESHALCSLHDDCVIMDGAVQLVTDSDITDLAWSGRDTRHVLTTHADGTIRLWDCKQLDTNMADGSGNVPAHCLHTIQEDEPVTRCFFLPHDDVVGSNESSTLTSAFVTASAGNSSVTLWSSFGESRPPTKLQVFGMEEPCSTYNLSMCFGPAPVDGSPPSCFLLLSDRSAGHVCCVHVRSKWSSESPKKALAVGLDYVVPLSTKYPIYSWSIFAAPAEDVAEEDVATGLNFDMKFYAYQSKMVQQYTLPHYMLLPPSSTWDASTTPGVRMEAVPMEITAFDEDYELDEDDKKDDEYDVAPDPSSLPAPDGLEPETKEAESSSNPFANWLGSLAAKSGMSGTQAPPPTPATPAHKERTPDIAAAPEHVPMPDVDRSMSEPTTRPTGSFLSPMALLSESGSDIERAAAKAAPKQPEGKKKKSPKAAQRKVEPKKSPPAPIAILKREDAAPAPPPAPPAAPSTGVSNIDSTALEATLERLLSSHFKRQDALLVDRVNKAVHSEIQTSVIPALSKTITQTMEQAVVKPVQKALDKSSSKESNRAQANAVAKAVSSSVEQPLRDAFSQSMKSTLIPAYEAATRQMFDQISAGLDKGLGETTSSSGVSTDVSAKIDSMARAIESLSTEVAQLRSAIGAGGLGLSDGDQAAGADKLQETRNEIVSLLQIRSYESAFTKALSASTAEMAVFCCKNSDLSDVLGGDSPALSQPILLCLMQQLGAILVSSTESDLQTVVSWLQEIALTLDPADESIQRHVPGVLQQLVGSINEKMAQGDPSMKRPLHMLLQVIRGMQR